MPNYLFSQMISITLIIIGWVITTAGSYLGYFYFTKLKLSTWLPSTLNTKLSTLPDWLFYTPAATIFLTGIIILGIGHILLVGIDNARYGAENSQLMDMVRMRG